MYYKFFVYILLSVVALSGCQKQQRVNAESADTTPVDTSPKAILHVPLRVDMGDFDYEHLKKSVTLQLSNHGNDSLYIINAYPECDCVEVELADSVIAPLSNTHMDVSLNLEGYLPGDTIVKKIVICSNNADERYVRVALVGILKKY